MNDQSHRDPGDQFTEAAVQKISDALEDPRRIESVMFAIVYEDGDGLHMAVQGGRQVSIRAFIETVDDAE